MKAKVKRLFTAIELPQSWLDQIQTTCLELKKQGVKGRYVPLDRLHLTLNFIGETALEDDIIRVMEALERSGPPLLTADRGGLFRRRRGGDLIVWHIRPDEALKAYQRAEAGALSELGIHMDRRPYRPHLTLARGAEGKFLNSSGFDSLFQGPKAFTAPEIVLLWSRFADGQLVYTPLGRYPFK